jgi:hypothetical protein
VDFVIRAGSLIIFNGHHVWLFINGGAVKIFASKQGINNFSRQNFRVKARRFVL